jgi:hypothetical protein
MTNTRRFGLSAMLRNGPVFVVDGEFSEAGSDTPLAEILDPVAFTRLKGGNPSVRIRGSHLTHALEDQL